MNDKYIHLENLIGAGAGSIYNLTILAAKRALQLADGDKALIEKPTEKVLDTALREIASGKICLKKKE
ncbi:MAG: DNA-directed RNA polymerase subunit omega [Candidatus Omnitrophica bacterium]|nr:DNA-directed RNA polymerase subunit omega [Candidatus Omnitrophota bacterium]